MFYLANLIFYRECRRFFSTVCIAHGIGVEDKRMGLSSYSTGDVAANFDTAVRKSSESCPLFSLSWWETNSIANQFPVLISSLHHIRQRWPRILRRPVPGTPLEWRRIHSTRMGNEIYELCSRLHSICFYFVHNPCILEKILPLR